MFQWGQRPGTTCDSGAFGVGFSTDSGALYHSACNFAWAAQASATGGTLLQSGAGYAPRQGTWNHVAITYTGTSSVPVLTETVYLDGVANSAHSSLSLAIRRDVLRLGSWVDGGATVALAQFRIHDGALTAAQIAYNYAQSSGAYVPSQTPTPTPSTTGTPTQSPSPTSTETPSGTPSPSGTQIASLSATPSPSSTGSKTSTATVSTSVSATPTPTIAFITAGILVDLQAIDYNAGAGSWNNRATTAPVVSLANGDFLAVTSAGAATPVANWPTAGTAGATMPNPAVIFAASGGAPQYLTGAAGLAALAGIFGGSDW